MLDAAHFLYYMGLVQLQSTMQNVADIKNNGPILVLVESKYLETDFWLTIFKSPENYLMC